MQRVHDWPRRLAAYVNARRAMPYAYGVNDCGSFVVDAIHEMTGHRLVPVDGRPTSRIGAARFLMPFAGSVEAWMDFLLGTRLTSPRLAQRGDVVSFAADGETHLALVVSEAAATPGPERLLWVPRALWRAGWKVG